MKKTNKTMMTGVLMASLALSPLVIAQTASPVKPPQKEPVKTAEPEAQTVLPAKTESEKKVIADNKISIPVTDIRSFRAMLNRAAQKATLQAKIEKAPQPIRNRDQIVAKLINNLNQPKSMQVKVSKKTGPGKFEKKGDFQLGMGDKKTDSSTLGFKIKAGISKKRAGFDPGFRKIVDSFKKDPKILDTLATFLEMAPDKSMTRGDRKILVQPKVPFFKRAYVYVDSKLDITKMEVHHLSGERMVLEFGSRSVKK